MMSFWVLGGNKGDGKGAEFVRTNLEPSCPEKELRFREKI